MPGTLCCVFTGRVKQGCGRDSRRGCIPICTVKIPPHPPQVTPISILSWGPMPPPSFPEPSISLSQQKASREEPYYSSVVFDFQSEDSKANRIRSQRTLEQETQYSVIKNT